MKKNFFFLKSLMALFVLSLFSANASAEDVWKRVMSAAELSNGDVITFVHEKDASDPYKGGYLYTDYRTAAKEYGKGIDNNVSGLPPFGGTRFALTSSAEYHEYFILKQEDKAGDNQLYQDGTLFNTGDSKEGVWKFDFADGVATMHTANTDNKFIWNQTAKCFVSSTAPGTVAIYKKVDAEAPTFSPLYALQVKKGDVSKFITASTTTADANVWYSLTGADPFTQGAQSAKVDVLGETVEGDWDHKTTTVTAYTQIGYGQTATQSQEYKLYRLDNATITPEGVVRVGTDGVLNLTAEAVGASACEVTIVEIDGNVVNVPLTTTGTASNPSFDVASYVGKNITVRAFFTRKELPECGSLILGSYTIKPYSDAVITYTADPVAGLNSKVHTGDVITLNAVVNDKAGDYFFSNNTEITTLTWKNGDKEVKSPAKLDGAKVTTKVPAELRGDGSNANWTLVVPAGLFIADTQNYTENQNYTVNKITSEAGSFAYAPDYAPISFTINPEQKEFVTDGTSDIKFHVAVYPSGAIEGKETINVDPSAIIVTNSQNEILSGDVENPVTISGSNGVYDVTFPVSVIKNYISSSNNKTDLMFSIKEREIKCTTDNSNAGVDYTTNNADVVAYVRFYEEVGIKLNDMTIAPEGKFCTQHDLPSVTFDITAVGKAKAENKYNVTLAEGAKATITGTDYAGEPVSVEAALSVANNKATVTIPATLNGRGEKNYSISVPANAFYVQTGTLEESRSFSPDKVYAEKLDARAHSTFKAETVNTKYEPTKTFQVEITATPENGNIIDALAYAMTADSKSVTVSDGSFSTKGTVAWTPSLDKGKGVATITTDALVDKEGTYTVTFDNAAFTVDCDKNKDLTCQLVVEEVVWSLDKVTPDMYEITDETTKFDVKIGAKFNEQAIDITAPETLTATIDGTSVTLTKGAVNEDKTVTYTVTTEKLAAAGNDAVVYTLIVDKDQLTAQTRPNNDLDALVSVYSYVYYELATQDVTNIDTKTTEYTFEIVMKDKNGKVLNRNLLKNLSATGDARTAENTIAFNSGHNSNFPTVEFVADENGQKRMLATTFQNLKQGNYQFNIPAHTLYAEANANDYKMYVNFSVKNHIAMSWAEDINAHVDVLGDIAEKELTYTGDAKNIDTKTTSFVVNVKGWDVESCNNATNLINLNGKFQIDGNDVTATATGNAGEYVISFEPLAAGNYTLTLAEKAMKASNTESKALSMPISVLEAVNFAAEDATVAHAKTTVDVKVADKKVVVLDGATATLKDKNGANVTVSIAASATDGYVTITNADSYLQELSVYALTIAANSLKADNTVWAEPLTCNITAVKELDFYDYADHSTEKAKATLHSDVVAATYDKLTYHRYFTGKMESEVLPFDIKYDDVKDGMKIYKVITLADGEDENGNPATALYIRALKEGETAYAGMPYIVKGIVAGEYEKVFTNVETKVLTNSQPLKFSSTVTDYTFNVNLTDKVIASDVNAYRMSGGILKHYTDSKINYYTWRWNIMPSQPRTDAPNYIKVVVDGFVVDEDGEATGIQFVPANEDANDAIYNLNGQKLNKAAKGVNIVNGKKVLVK